MAAKKIEAKVLWSIDADRRTIHNGPSSRMTLYEIHESNPGFLVMYYGCCDVHRSNTLQEAKDYVMSKIEEINNVS